MQAGERSQFILGRIRRILEKNYGFEVDKFQNGEIYDEMQQAQIQIFGEVLPEKIYEIVLATNTNQYSLINNFDDLSVIDKIKSVILPDDWEYTFELVSNARWQEILKTTFDSAQPQKGTIIGNDFYVFPIPDSTYDGAIITLVTNLRAPSSVISEKIDPELTSQLYDKPIEWLALFSLTGDSKWIELYKVSIGKLLSKGNTLADEEIVKDCEW